MGIQEVKQRFGIIGSSGLLDRAIDTAMRVASTDLSVLITGESGVGKEAMPKIIHQLSTRKHGKYIAVNCGAIPEGTIDSELFGHEKGAFTGAQSTRQGYFEEADGGSIFLDEVAELPLQTQVRLLRVLETGEFIKVGSSKVQKTDVRIIAATNVNVPEMISKGKFREDLYYRLNTVPIVMPALRERKEDIHLLFRKFAADFAEKYRMPVVRLDEDSIELLSNYRWKGNIRQLKNITEQLSVIEQERQIDRSTLLKYLPEMDGSNLPVVYNAGQEDLSEREILYKVLFDLKNDVTDLKKVVSGILQDGAVELRNADHNDVISGLQTTSPVPATALPPASIDTGETGINEFYQHEEVEESLSLEDKELEMIKRALDKHRGKRKYAAKELGISERTLYRKIKEYDLK